MAKCYKCGAEMKPGEGSDYPSPRLCFHNSPEACINHLAGRLEAMEIRLDEMVKDDQLTREEVMDIKGEDF